MYIMYTFKYSVAVSIGIVCAYEARATDVRQKCVRLHNPFTPLFFFLAHVVNRSLRRRSLSSTEYYTAE